MNSQIDIATIVRNIESRFHTIDTAAIVRNIESQYHGTTSILPFAEKYADIDYKLEYMCYREQRENERRMLESEADDNESMSGAMFKMDDEPNPFVEKYADLDYKLECLTYQEQKNYEHDSIVSDDAVSGIGSDNSAFDAIMSEGEYNALFELYTDDDDAYNLLPQKDTFLDDSLVCDAV